jgi:hypothetical protein
MNLPEIRLGDVVAMQEGCDIVVNHMRRELVPEQIFDDETKSPAHYRIIVSEDGYGWFGIYPPAYVKQKEETP